MSQDRHINFALMRDRLLATRGKEYWRNLEELADSDEFQEFVAREYPQHAEEWTDPVGRRTFMKLMGASLALAGLSACVYQPTEKIVPFVRQPEGMLPGRPLYFATAMSLGGVAAPLLVRSNEGRPTKIEGNDMHGASLGATDVFSQASLLTLYDPDRSQILTYLREIRTWSAFLAEVSAALDTQRGKQGAGLRILTETVTSPSLAGQITDLLKEFPQAKWHQYEPVGRGSSSVGAFQAFGQAVNVIYDFSKAERILSLDADFLACGPGSLRYARDFSAKRRVEKPDGATMNRLYVVESTPTSTGAKADHRLGLRPSEIEGFARAVAVGLGVEGIAATSQNYSAHAEWIAALVSDLYQFRGASIVIAGDEQPPGVHALAHAINKTLNNIGSTVIYTDALEARAPGQENTPLDYVASLRDLVNDIDAGRVELLVVVGGNPVYNAPADLHFKESYMKVALRAHLSLYDDETSELSHWHIPETHYLEAWGDARAYDGTVSIIQPLIAPLYRNSKSANEFLAAFSRSPERTGYDIVREYWHGRIGRGGQAAATATPSTQASTTGNQTSGTANQSTVTNNRSAAAAPPVAQSPAATASPAATTTTTTAQPAATPSGDFEQEWRKILHDGFVPNTALPQKSVTLKGDWASSGAQPSAPASGIEIVFRADPTIYDGRFANNGWLQELPKPLTKITWDNVAIISPALARRHGLSQEVGWKGGENYVDVVNLNFQGRTVRAPVWILPGQPDNCVTVHLGYGRWRGGRAGTGTSDHPVGFNASAIRSSTAFWSGSNVEIQKTGDRYQIATTQLHHLMENRDIIRAGTLEEYRKNPHLAPQNVPPEPAKDDTLYPNYEYNGYAWGMAIDVNSCVGCNACVVACQSENNIPVVGKEQVLRSREMHWLRVDSYYKGGEDDPAETYFQPVPCMHCENAPCEPVCPVAATVHSAEGTNDMVYNRCVGTRYCSNNCPYKVRRFNFLLYQDFETPTYKLMRNPEVSVRSRGVMEKCTYCIQRIQHAKIETEKEGRAIIDGEVKTACQTVCPTEAIVFGNINDKNSKVARLKAQERNYGLLEDLNTRPRTTYLAAIRNPNPQIKA